jgi:hypothetical protein
MINFIGGSQGAGVPPPIFMKREIVHESNVKPIIPASKASQNQISVGVANLGGQFEFTESTRMIVGIRTSAVPGRMISDLTSPQCISRLPRESSPGFPDHGSCLKLYGGVTPMDTEGLESV